MKTPTFKQRFQYWFDNYMSRGTGALIGGLSVIAAIVIFVAAAADQHWRTSFCSGRQ